VASYEIRLKEAALQNLKASREQVLRYLGNAQVGQRLAGMDEQQAGNLANDLLALLDAVDSIVSRAKRAD
jgi:hypothetical protein